MINALIFIFQTYFLQSQVFAIKKKYLQSFANTDCFILFVTSQTCLQCRMNFPLISTIVLYKKNKTTLNFIYITIDDYFSYFDEIISQNMSKYHIRYYDEQNSVFTFAFNLLVSNSINILFICQCHLFESELTGINHVFGLIYNQITQTSFMIQLKGVYMKEVI